MKNTFTCLLSFTLIFSGIYGCNKNEVKQHPTPVAQLQSATGHNSSTLNHGALHNKVVWAYISAKPQEQTAFTKAEVLQMTRDILTIMADEGYYEGHLEEPEVLSAEMLAGMEAIGYFNTSGKLKSTQELKELPLYADNDNPLQKIINKINLIQAGTGADFILAAKNEMNNLSGTAFQATALAFNSIIDSSYAMTPVLVTFALPSLMLPSASNLRVAYADAKGYTEGTKAAQDLGKNSLQQDIWGMTYSTTRSVQQLKRELGM